MRPFQLLASILFLLNAGVVATAQNKADKEGFVLVKKDGAVSIYERWITYPASNPPIKAREVKGEFFFNNTIFAGLRLIQDETRIKAWQSHVSEFKVYPQRDSSTWLEYSYHDIPWPVSDQDHFLEYKVVEAVPSRKLVITFQSRVNGTLAPVRDGVTRMQLSGSWTLEQVTPKQVKVTYRILSKPIGIPKFLTDPIIRSNIMTTIEEYVALLEPGPK